MTKQKGYTVVEMLLAIAFLIGAAGWIWNIVKLAGSNFSDVTGMLVLRCFGVIIPPLGAVIGFL